MWGSCRLTLSARVAISGFMIVIRLRIRARHVRAIAIIWMLVVGITIKAKL